VQHVWQDLCYRALRSVKANLNSFTDSIKNYKLMQKGFFGIGVVVKDVTTYNAKIK